MRPYEVIAFDDDARLLEMFVQLPFDLYAGDPCWSAPSRQAVVDQLSPNAPFRRHGSVRNFLALSDRRNPCGRISAIINDDLLSTTGKIGHVGMFECDEDYGTARALLDSAIAYLEEQGCTEVWGPLNFTTLHGYRFVTRGFQTAPFYSEPYHRQHYSDLFLSYGFRPLRSYNSAITTKPAEVMPRYAAKRAQLEERGYFIRDCDPSQFDQEMLTLHRLIMEIFADNFGFTTIDTQEFLPLYEHYREKLLPQHLRFVHTGNGRPVAFLIAIPDFTGRYKNTMITKMLGVGKSCRGQGISESLYHDAMKFHLAEGCTALISPLRINGNPSERFGGEETFEIFREYTLYSMPVSPRSSLTSASSALAPPTFPPHRQE